MPIRCISVYPRFNHLLHCGYFIWYGSVVNRKVTKLLEKQRDKDQVRGLVNTFNRIKMRCWKVIERISCELAQNQIIRRQVETSNNAARDAHAQLSFMVRDITMLAKSVHGFKHHTVDNAFGMTMDLIGPYFLRKNDLKLLTFSNINGRLRYLQEGAPEQLLTMCGNSIYPRLSHLKSSLRREGKNLHWMELWAIGNLYGYLSNHSKLK